jgi:hypothetical protein
MNKLTRHATFALVLVGLAIRLFLIFPGPLQPRLQFFTNTVDLRNYYWPASTALRGEDPYALWARGESGEFRSDMAPLELMVYVAAVAVWNDPRAIQLLFAFCDIVNIVLLGMLLRNSRLRLAFQVFYALGPLTLFDLTLVPQDKTILLTLSISLYYFLKRIAENNLRFTFYALLTASIIAAFKWLSIFYAIPLLLFLSPNFRALIKHSLILGTIIALAHVPWFPTWQIVYTFRASRLPDHISLASLANGFGLYDARFFAVLLLLELGAIYFLFWWKRLDIFETIALSTAAGMLWALDMDPVHLALVCINLLLVVNWVSVARLIAVWAASAWVAAVYLLTTHASLGRFSLAGPQALVGVYGSPRMILFSFLLFVILLGYYMHDKIQGKMVGEAVLDGEAA